MSPTSKRVAIIRVNVEAALGGTKALQSSADGRGEGSQRITTGTLWKVDRSP